ncbi:hypothetical protein PHMEG_00025676, partial [Phytophthora megakarya]
MERSTPQFPDPVLWAWCISSKTILPYATQIERIATGLLLSSQRGGLRERLKIKDGSAKDRREHVDYYIETLEDQDIAERLTLLRLTDADDLEEVLRARDRAKNRQKKFAFGSGKYRQKTTNTAPSSPAKQVRAIQIQANDSGSDSESDGSGGSDSDIGSHRRIFLAANEDVRKTKWIQEALEPWLLTVCYIHEVREEKHLSDHCLFVCRGCGELYDMGKCPMEEFYNHTRQWFNPTKHMDAQHPRNPSYTCAHEEAIEESVAPLAKLTKIVIPSARCTPTARAAVSWDDEKGDSMSPMYDRFIRNGGESIMQMINFAGGQFNRPWQVVEDFVMLRWNVGQGKKCKFGGKDVMFMALASLKHCSKWDVYFVEDMTAKWGMRELVVVGNIFSNFPGKHSIHGYKVNVSVLPTGKAINCTQHYPGHAKYPDEWALLADKGYQGFSTHFRAITPHKKQPCETLLIGQLNETDQISHDRVKGGYDILFKSCVSLTNYHVHLNPMRAEDGDHY